MHELISVLAATLLSSGGLASIGWIFLLRPQRRALGATARKTDADADGSIAEAAALLIEPFKSSILVAQQAADRANKRAANAERRLALIEQFIEGPDRIWHEAAVREITRLGGHVDRPPVLAHRES